MNLKQYCEEEGITLSTGNVEFYGSGEVKELHHEHRGGYFGWKLSMIGDQSSFLLETEGEPAFAETVEELGENEVTEWWEKNGETVLGSL